MALGRSLVVNVMYVPGASSGVFDSPEHMGQEHLSEYAQTPQGELKTDTDVRLAFRGTTTLFTGNMQ